MSEELVRMVIALAVVAGFFVMVLIILIGFVDIRQPEIAKLVGMLVGYATAILNPVIYRYFGGPNG